MDFEFLASPYFAGLMYLTMVGMLWQLVAEIKGVRIQLKALYDQRERSRHG